MVSAWRSLSSCVLWLVLLLATTCTVPRHASPDLLEATLDKGHENGLLLLLHTQPRQHTTTMAAHLLLQKSVRR